MSSSNRVKIVAIKETVYGETPVAGNFFTARFINETLSGTPDTTESQQIRADRQSSGQVVTGLEVGGDLGFELAKEAALEEFMASAMLNTWDVLAPIAREMSIDSATKKLSSATGSFITDGLVKGDFVKLSGFANAANNVLAMVKSVTALEVELATKDALVTEAAVATAVVTRGDKLTIGTEIQSFSMEKVFEDLTEKAIDYKGMTVGTMEINANYGELMNGTFGFMGNDYQPKDDETEFITNGRTITAPATTDTLNGSIDMPFIATSATGALDTDGLCIQSFSVSLDNNLQDLTCIGRAAPEGYDAGTAAIQVSLSSYLKDNNWAILPKKLTQESFEIGFPVLKNGVGYGFFFPAVQVTFPDPSSAGANQQVSLAMEGTAKVGPNGESAMSIYKF